MTRSDDLTSLAVWLRKCERAGKLLFGDNWEVLIERVDLLERYSQRLKEHNTELTLRNRELLRSGDDRLAELIKSTSLNWEDLTHRFPPPRRLPRRLP